MAKGRGKARGKPRRAGGKSKRRSSVSPALQWALLIVLLLGAGVALYRSWEQVRPRLRLFPQPLNLTEATLARLKQLPRLKSLQPERVAREPRGGLVIPFASLSFDNETELILAEQAIEDFWKSQTPPLQVDVAYPEDAAGGAALLIANAAGAPVLAIRLYQREVPPETLLPKPHPALPAAATVHARIAIVIDDLGNSPGPAQQLAALPVPVTLAIIPFTPFAAAAEQAASRAGKEIILHMPMEPQDYPQQEPGPGALLLRMSPAEIGNALLAALQEVPEAQCLNNHMGSAFTEDPAAMATVMRVLKSRGLCFLDSRTSPHSAGLEQAAQFGVPYAKRDVFLDNDRTPFAIRRRLLELTHLARAHGSAIGIGHPYPETIAVLEETLPKLKSLGYQIVPLSKLAE
jgi:hypothetical protein